MKLKVNSVSIVVTEPEIIVAHAVKTYECEFEFDDTWGEYQKKAEFKKGHVVKEVLLEDNKCVIPWEVLKARGFLKIGVYGVCGDKRRPTLWTDNILISEGAFEGDEEKEPTKTLFQRVVEIMDETKAISQSVRDDADAGKFNGRQGERGEPGSIRFIPVVTLPTENIDESAIYLLPLENEAGENRFTEYAYIDGKWEVIGAITVQVDHSEYVKFTDYASELKAGVLKIPSSIIFGVDSKGFFYLNVATSADIKERNARLLNSMKIDEIVKAGLTTNGENWSTDEQKSARDLIGAVGSEDYATNEKAGVVKNYYNQWASGIEFMRDGSIRIAFADNGRIDAKHSESMPIVPKNLDYATMKALSDCKDTTLWTDDTTENGKVVKGTKTKALELLGALQKGTTDQVQLANGTTMEWHYGGSGNSLARRLANGSLWAQMSGAYNENELVNMGYIHNLPDYLTNMTAEQKAKWKAWLESISN